MRNLDVCPKFHDNWCYWAQFPQYYDPANWNPPDCTCRCWQYCFVGNRPYSGMIVGRAAPTEAWPYDVLIILPFEKPFFCDDEHQTIEENTRICVSLPSFYARLWSPYFNPPSPNPLYNFTPIAIQWNGHVLMLSCNYNGQQILDHYFDGDLNNEPDLSNWFNDDQFIITSGTWTLSGFHADPGTDWVYNFTLINPMQFAVYWYIGTDPNTRAYGGARCGFTKADLEQPGNFLGLIHNNKGWGSDWPDDPVGADEVQKITVTDATGGYFTLTFGGQETGPIYFDATSADLISALEALSSIGGGNVLVTGDPGGTWTVEFVGTLGLQDVAMLVATDYLEGDGHSIDVAVEHEGIADVAYQFVVIFKRECWWWPQHDKRFINVAATTHSGIHKDAFKVISNTLRVVSGTWEVYSTYQDAIAECPSNPTSWYKFNGYEYEYPYILGTQRVASGSGELRATWLPQGIFTMEFAVVPAVGNYNTYVYIGFWTYSIEIPAIDISPSYPPGHIYEQQWLGFWSDTVICQALTYWQCWWKEPDDTRMTLESTVDSYYLWFPISFPSEYMEWESPGFSTPQHAYFGSFISSYSHGGYPSNPDACGDCTYHHCISCWRGISTPVLTATVSGITDTEDPHWISAACFNRAYDMPLLTPWGSGCVWGWSYDHYNAHQNFGDFYDCVGGWQACAGGETLFTGTLTLSEETIDNEIHYIFELGIGDPYDNSLVSFRKDIGTTKPTCYSGTLVSFAPEDIVAASGSSGLDFTGVSVSITPATPILDDSGLQNIRPTAIDNPNRDTSYRCQYCDCECRPCGRK